MALKDTQAVVGETPVPEKYLRISWIRFDYPAHIAAGINSYIDKVSADSNGPVLEEQDIVLDAEYVYSKDEAAVLSGMLTNGATLRDVAAAMAYMQIKKDERFANLEDA